MKTCAYCGKDNEDAAIRCFECGTEEFETDAAATTAASPAAGRPPAFRLRDIVSDPAKLFRALVVISNSAYLLSLLTTYFESQFLSYETVELLNQGGHGSWFTIPSSVYWLTAAIYFAIAIGLYHFSSSARLVFTIFTIAFGLMALLGGVAVSSPIVGFLTMVTTMADGAILLLAYATPLKRRFG